MYNYLKNQHLSLIANWMRELAEKDYWKLFTCTVVFKPIDMFNSKERWMWEYKERFLRKIQRRLESHAANQQKSIPFDFLYYFERFQSPLFKKTNRRKPFHVHSLIPIKSEQVYRFWSYDNNALNERLFKDLTSINTVQDFLIEPVIDKKTINWLRYITKEKNYD